ncbi:hypothetical protein L218DRAFT_954230, partial [Marasmius fiardii PR-910]
MRRDSGRMWWDPVRRKYFEVSWFICGLILVRHCGSEVNAVARYELGSNFPRPRNSKWWARLRGGMDVDNLSPSVQHNDSFPTIFYRLARLQAPGRRV